MLSSILEAIQGLPLTTVLDGFSGTTRVSQMFAGLGLHTTACDCSDWSEVLGTCFLLNTREPVSYQPLIDHLNAVPGYDGWFTEHYGGTPESPEKRPFQAKNTRRLDGIRDEIDRLGLDPTEKAVALTSLILALDTVDNTLGHFSAYLSGWSPRSHQDLLLKVPRLTPQPPGKHAVIKGDIFETIDNQWVDLAYFDPPYGSNNGKMPASRVRYAAYYHLWTTVIRHDKPAVFGKANRREDSRDFVAPSVFEEFRKDANGHFIAIEAIRRLISQTQARYILLSYSSGGRATKEELHAVLTASGTLLKVLEVDYQRNVMSAMRWTDAWVSDCQPYREYLFLIETGKSPR